MDCLLEDDNGAVRLEGLFDLLRVFLGDTLFEYLWHRLNKLLCLWTKQSVLISAKEKNKRTTDLDECEVGHERLDLLDDFWLGAPVERFKLHVEDRLFFRLGSSFLFIRVCIVCVC